MIARFTRWMRQTQRSSQRGEGSSLCICFVCCSIINLSPIPGLKVSSAARNNVLCMLLSVKINKKTGGGQTVPGKLSTVSFVKIKGLFMLVERALALPCWLLHCSLSEYQSTFGVTSSLSVCTESGGLSQDRNQSQGPPLFFISPFPLKDNVARDIKTIELHTFKALF